MATRKPSRSEWQLKSGKWTRSLGSRGTRVRLFQKRSGGLFYRAFWVPSRGVDRKCLGTVGRAEAEKLGKALLGVLLKVTRSSPRARYRWALSAITTALGLLSTKG